MRFPKTTQLNYIYVQHSIQKRWEQLSNIFENLFWTKNGPKTGHSLNWKNHFRKRIWKQKLLLRMYTYIFGNASKFQSHFADFGLKTTSKNLHFRPNFPFAACGGYRKCNLNLRWVKTMHSHTVHKDISKLKIKF